MQKLGTSESPMTAKPIVKISTESTPDYTKRKIALLIGNVRLMNNLKTFEIVKYHCDNIILTAA